MTPPQKEEVVRGTRDTIYINTPERCQHGTNYKAGTATRYTLFDECKAYGGGAQWLFPWPVSHWLASASLSPFQTPLTGCSDGSDGGNDGGGGGGDSGVNMQMHLLLEEHEPVLRPPKT